MSEQDLICKELAAAGVPVSSIYDLVKIKASYRAALPVLIKHLRQVNDTKLKEGIVRALTVRWGAKTVAVPMIYEFENYEANDSEKQVVKWAMGNALSELAHSENFEDLVRLITNKKHGTARQMLTFALVKANGLRCVDVLISLIGDSDLTGHVISALAKANATKAKPFIEKFLQSENSFWRKEAKAALKKI